MRTPHIPHLSQCSPFFSRSCPKDFVSSTRFPSPEWLKKSPHVTQPCAWEALRKQYLSAWACTANVSLPLLVAHSFCLRAAGWSSLSWSPGHLLPSKQPPSPPPFPKYAAHRRGVEKKKFKKKAGRQSTALSNTTPRSTRARDES